MPEGDTTYTHRGTRAVQRMVEHAPSSGGLALWVHHRDLPASAATNGAEDAAPLSTDGKTIDYSPGFAQLPLPLQAGHVAHAVLHIALRHAQRYQSLQRRSGDADLQLFNVCADAIVNSALAHLGWLQLPAEAVVLEALLAQSLNIKLDAHAALMAWDVERLYRAIDDRQAGTALTTPDPREDRRQRGGQAAHAQRQGSGGGAADEKPDGQKTAPAPARGDGPRAARVRALARPQAADLRPGPGTSGAPEDEAEAAREWFERLQRAHAGDGPHSMLRTLLADLPRQRTPWEQALRAQLAHGLTQRPGLSWSRPARSYLANQGRSSAGRRLPWEPGTTASRSVPRLVVVVDVSGSIDTALMGRFAGEIEAISRRLEAGIVLVIGDERVQRVETFQPGVRGLGGSVSGPGGLGALVFQGGGGTDFTLLLEEAQRHRPDITVVLTDLQGPARFRPRCPVIWAVPDAYRDAVPPFGRLLALH